MFDGNERPVEAGDDDDRGVLEVVGLPLDRGEDPGLAEVAAGPGAGEPAVEGPGLAVEPGELVLHVGVADDDELPVLGVAAGRRLHREAQQLEDGLVVDRDPAVSRRTARWVRMASANGICNPSATSANSGIASSPGRLSRRA